MADRATLERLPSMNTNPLGLDRLIQVQCVSRRAIRGWLSMVKGAGLKIRSRRFEGSNPSPRTHSVVLFLHEKLLYELHTFLHT